MIKCSTDRKENGEKIRMIALDLTVLWLTSDKVLTDRKCKGCFGRAIEQHCCEPVRNRASSPAFQKRRLEFPGVRYAVTANGARIVDSLEGRILYEDQVSYENGKKVLEICGKYDALLRCTIMEWDIRKKALLIGWGTLYKSSHGCIHTEYASAR